MSNLLIRQCFESLLSALSLLQNPPMHIAFENVISENQNSSYVECSLQPSNNTTESLDGAHNCYSGIFQIVVICKKGFGYGEAGLIAEAITNFFKCDSRFEYGPITVTIIEPPSIMTAVTTDRNYCVPILITYRTDTI